MNDLYWFCSPACSGKSTLAELVSKEKQLAVYCLDNHQQAHLQKANKTLHPNIYASWANRYTNTNWLNEFDDSEQIIKNFIYFTILERGYIKRELEKYDFPFIHISSQFDKKEILKRIYNLIGRMAILRDEPIGECRFQEMNIQEIKDLYPAKDVRRIDMAISEKQYHFELSRAEYGDLSKQPNQIQQ